MNNIPECILKNFRNDEGIIYSLNKKTGEIKSHKKQKCKLIKSILGEFTERNREFFNKLTFENKILFLKELTSLQSISNFDITNTAFNIEENIYYIDIDLYEDNEDLKGDEE